MGVKALKYKLPQEFNVIPTVQSNDQKSGRKYTKNKSYFSGKIVMDKTDIGLNCLSNWPPLHSTPSK